MSSMTSGVAVAVRARTGGRPSCVDARSPRRQVVGPEVVPPLADAVRLVDHEQVDRVPAQEGPELGVGELLWGRVDELLAAVRDRHLRLVAFGGGEGAVDRHDLDALVRAATSAWSFISAISGLTTTVVPSSSSAGSWKQRLLPEPVGMTTSVSRPSSADRTAFSWPGRKWRKPKCWRNRCVSSSRRGTVSTTIVLGMLLSALIEAWGHGSNDRRGNLPSAESMES